MKLISLYELVSDAKLGAETELRSVKFGCILTFGNLEKSLLWPIGMEI